MKRGLEHWTLICLLATTSILAAGGSDAELVKRGEYLARASDCISCHTAPDRPEFDPIPYAGGLPMKLPVGTVFSTNITPDVETGIGAYSIEDFDRAMRRGVRRDGKPLYPAMPYTSFTRMSTEDVRALYAYFMHGLAPVKRVNIKPKLIWPASSRSTMRIWNHFFFHPGEYQLEPGRDAQWNRGAYLVQALGHCGGCHTMRGIAGQEKASSEKDARFLRGGKVDNWYASDLTGNAVVGLEAWSPAELVQYLKTGRTQHSGAFGPMSEVVSRSTQYVSESDLQATAAYLKSLPASTGSVQPPNPAEKSQALARDTALLKAGNTARRGAQAYLDRCNACHESDGGGAARTFPSLAGSEVVNGDDATSLIHIVLHGSAMPSTRTAPSELGMPDFASRLSDAEIADVLTFVRTSWGNQARAVKACQVRRMRKKVRNEPPHGENGAFGPGISRAQLELVQQDGERLLGARLPHETMSPCGFELTGPRRR